MRAQHYKYFQKMTIQDNDNLEMMTHLEGPIVDSFYDVCLNSWHNQLHPPLPAHNSPAAKASVSTFQEESFHSIFDKHGTLKDLTGASPLTTEDQPLAAPAGSGNRATLPEHTASDPHYDPDIASEILRGQVVLSAKGGEGRMAAITRHLSKKPKPLPKQSFNLSFIRHNYTARDERQCSRMCSS